MKAVVAGLIFLFTVFLFSAAGKANSGGPLDSNALLNLCKDSDDQCLCVSSLQTCLESGDAVTNSDQIGVVAITVASANASSTAAYMKERIRNEDLEPAIETTLEDCHKNYLDAAEQLDDSIAGLLVNAYTEVDVWLCAAIEAVESCQVALDSRAGIDSELSRRNVVVVKLLKNALMINNKLAA